MNNLLLYDGYTVSESFFNRIRRQVQEIIPAMLPGEQYTLELLCGKIFWANLSDGDRRKAGRCMAYMVKKGLLRLKSAITRHEYPKRYQLL